MNFELRCKVKTTPHEFAYRKEHCQDDLTMIDDDDMQCTACGDQLIAKKGRCFINRVVGTLQCQICYERCEDKEPWRSTNRSHFCIMCGKSSEQMQKCAKKDCSYSSCQVCILRNKSDASVETNKRRWNCFICNIEQLYPRRAVAATVMASLSEKSRERVLKNSDMKNNDNELSGINTKENVQKRTRAKVIISSDSELSSNASEANIFQKKIATQKSSTSTKSLKSLCIGTKTKTYNVDLRMINSDDDDDDDDLISNGHAEQSDDRKGTQQFKIQKSKEQKKKNVKKIHENNNDDIKKWEGPVSRANSNSSSDKEFSRHKIIHSYVSLQRISDIEKDYTVSPAQSLSPSPPSNSTLSKQDAFVLKNHVHKFFLEMKQSIKKLENKIEFIERNYHYKQKLKRKDATRMMMECTRMVRDWKEHVNTSEDKVVNRYNTWCKKARVKNIFINKSHVSNNIDTPNRYKEKINKSILIPSSDSDSDQTVVNYPIIHKSSSMHSIRSHDGAQAVDEVENQEQNNQPENIIERNLSRNKILDSSDESDVELRRNISPAHGQCVNEIDDDNVRDSSPIQNVDKSINNSKNSPIKQTERSSTPESKLDSNLNFDYSPQSSIDMFQDDNEIENNEENSLPLMTTEAQIHELPAKKNSPPKNKFINEDNNEKEKKKSKKTIPLDDSSSGSDDKILSESNKKSRSSTDEKKENQEKPPEKQSSEAKEKLIDNCNDESLVINNNPIDNDSSVDDNEEQARKALLDSSSDSEPEAIFNTSNEDNNLLLGDDELSDNDNIMNDKTKERRESQKSITSSNNCSISAKSKTIKFILRNNVHYKNDVKLRYVTTVKLSKLGKNILSQHSNALKESKEYLENKQVKSLMSIDNIEKKKKKTHSSASSEDGETSMKRSEKSRKKDKEAEETLLDHLNKVTENNEENNSDNEDDRNSVSKNDSSNENDLENLNISTESFTSTADKLYKDALLESSHSEAEATEDNEKNKPVSDNDSEKSDVENINEISGTQTKSKENTEKTNKRRKSSDSGSDIKVIKDDMKNDKSRWKRSKMLTMTFSSTDSEDEERKIKKKMARQEESSKNGAESGDKDEDNEHLTDSSPIKKKRTRRRRLASDDSDIKITDDSNSSDSDADNEKKNESSDNKQEDGKKSGKRRRKSDNSSDSSTPLEVRKSKLKRKRIRAIANDSDSESGNEYNSSQGGNKSGRKNIRKVLKDKQVAEDTKQAGKLEEERLKRMADRQKLYNEMYEARLANEKKVDKLVLDFDEESKEVLLSADEKLVRRLKPHQARGIKFMWDAAFESLERAKTTSGSGCILAHCMGLGKSFQVVTLAHTLLSNSEKTNVNTILIVAPLSTVLNWVNEFKIWLTEVENGDDIEIYEMTKCKTTTERKYQLENWSRTGGILIIGYEMFRNLTNATKKVKKSVRESILKCLVDPGADLVVCDEGHLLKNEDSAISKAMRRIRTLRRIVLTGTPLQNNLIEYHCMVQFVKPNLLGTKKEFLNRFANPIQNGQFDNSTEYDVKVMKKRAHVLHKMLEGSVQRFDYSVLMPFLPPKQEYVILLRLTDVQVKLYQYYIDKKARQQVRMGSTLFADFQALQRIWTHPLVVKMYTAKMIEKRREVETDSEGSLKDFIDDDDSDSNSSSKSSSNNDSDTVHLDSSDDQKKTNRRGTRANPLAETIDEPEVENKEWWSEFVKPEDLDDLRVSAKLLILFDIIKECEAMGDKVLVFSQSLYSLTLIEKFLGMIDDETQKGNELESLDNHTGSWSLGLDYFRLDGSTSADNRSQWVKSFNRPSNTRARLFLISTRAGGLGINLTAANRVVIFDASWNPSHDVQSIFRIYRFGQKKPCYVYRLLAAGTMEEKIYNRQVTKLSLSCRVVDEQQIERHFSNSDLAELYTFEPPNTEPSQLALPKDRLIAEIFLRHKKLVETYHEHDSLLENIAEEELDDEERKQAWLEYEQEKLGKRPMLPMNVYPTLYQQQTMMIHQSNNQMMNSFNMNEIDIQKEFANLLQFIRQDYPHLTESAQKDMAFRALSNMYNYVENRASTNLTNANMNMNMNMNMNNMHMNIPNVSNPTATLANALAQQEYTRQHSTTNKYHQQHQQQLQQQQMQYAQKFGNNVGKSTPTVGKTAATSHDDDVVEIPSSSSAVNSTLPATSSTKSQEE
ncbi:hypothetical protein PV325_005517 [Microctonus aethiopoides]|uniref:Transcriptional regulator ATRX n=1 Tax=Microctonus aethiopoides TaxID=144406 RepID=A0AA39EXN2_9HYME|nr:hypothetical protein PV325_005517 [Microctonus aethiopoides]KAK0158699.1 hypothetical protein PV328_009675 [Microctonus aethiopoides]